MAEKILFRLTANEHLPLNLTAPGVREGSCVTRRFPDGETYVRVDSDVVDRTAIVVCTLDRPDPKLLPLYYLARTLADLGAGSVVLVAPYLSYMRQDARFQSGESVTSVYFGDLLSSFLDRIVTVDPHLHRHESLGEVFELRTERVSAAPAIANWVSNHLDRPVLFGPDDESEQWVSAVADHAGVPYVVLEKRRHGDRNVEISAPDLEPYRDHTPVLLDDIISTGRTLITSVRHLLDAGLDDPVCIGIHPVFGHQAFDDLDEITSEPVISCNTIAHPSNRIDVSAGLRDAVAAL